MQETQGIEVIEELDFLRDGLRKLYGTDCPNVVLVNALHGRNGSNEDNIAGLREAETYAEERRPVIIYGRDCLEDLLESHGERSELIRELLLRGNVGYLQTPFTSFDCIMRYRRLSKP